MTKLTVGVVNFELRDVPEPHGDEVGHVGEVGRGHKHVVLCPKYVLLYDQVKSAKFIVVIL